jgi:hypothetical protein
VSRRAIALLALALAVAAGACAGSGDAGPSPFPSGSLGPVTPAAASEAIRGLCEMVGATDREAAATVFLDRSHQTLHVIAAATDVVDRAAGARLLEAKQVIEADLTEPVLPDGFGDDVAALIDATRGALDAIDLDAPACPA